MTKPTTVTFARTEDLDPATRTAIIHVCVAATQEVDFYNLFSYFPGGGRHFLAYDGAVLVSHAVVTTRWVQPEGLPMLKTAYVDAVATLPAYQGQGFGSAVMQHLAAHIDDYEIACLQTERQSFYARLGWEEWRGPLAGQGAEGLVPTPDQRGVMILRLPRTPPLILDGLLTVKISGRIW